MPRTASPRHPSPVSARRSRTGILPSAAALLVLSFFCAFSPLHSESPLPDFTQIEAPEHDYWNRALQDPFTRVIEDLEAGRLPLDSSSEKAFVASLLDQLKIPASSQLLVFSTTSLQLSLISPRSPRALYFNEDVYLGYVPRGRIEVVSLDPVAGAIFYIFNIPREPGQQIRVDRSNRCMNCHADAVTREVPGLVIQSVIPGPRGGSLDSFRSGDTGHHIPLDQRFGGWYLTGHHGIPNHYGNVTGRFVAGEIELLPATPGETFDFERYPAPTSDILAHLVFEHQTGFVNRAIEAAYLTRTLLHASGGNSPGDAAAAELDRKAAEFARYVLFADEAALPPDGIRGDPGFTEAFLAGRRMDGSQRSLKDLDLKTRLFQNRCSYMIYSRIFQNLPEMFKHRVYRELQRALRSDDDPGFAYLSLQERIDIQQILDDTLPDWRAPA